MTDGPFSHGYEYDVWGNMTHRYGWGGEVQGGTPLSSTDITYTYASNRRTDRGFTYDQAGNLTFDGGQTFTYDAAGRQASSDFTNLQNSYDGDGLRVKRTQDGSYPALYLRSSVLGGQVVAEIDFVNGSWQWWRGYVYAGSQLLAVQSGGVFFVHEDPVTKSKRVTNMSGVIQSTVETDPFGADTNKSSNSAFQPRKFTSYERDANGTDEAMFRRYNRWHSRFDQPDPYDGSYSLVNPQSFNRYAYVQGDPVNFVDPTGLDDFTISWWTNPDGSIGSSGFSLDGGTTYGGPQSVMIGGLGDRGFVVQVHLLSEAGLGGFGGGPQNPNRSFEDLQRDADNRDKERQLQECIKQAYERYKQKWKKEVGASGLAKKLFKGVVPNPQSIASGGFGELVGRAVGDIPSFSGFFAGIWAQSAVQFEVNVVNTFLESANRRVEEYDKGKEECLRKSYEARRG